MIRSWWFKIIAIGLPAFGAYLLFLDGFVTGRFLNKNVTFTIEPPRPGANPGRIVAILPPARVSEEVYSRIQRPHLAEFGLVLAVGVPREDTDSQVIVEAVFLKLIELFEDMPTHTDSGDPIEKEVCLLGMSMGGPMAADLVRYNSRMGNPLVITGFAAIDPPWDADDIPIPALRLASKVIRPGLFSNALLGWAVQLWHKPPPPGKGVKPEHLEEHHNISKRWPWSGIAGMGRIVCSFEPVEPSELAHIPNRALMRAIHDNDVKASATPKWLHGLGRKIEDVIWVDSPHCDLVGFPDVWTKALVGLLRKFYPEG